MNRSRHAILVPLFAVLALLCCLTETASAAFNHAATEPHYGNFLLRESKASDFSAYEIADPIKENGEWIYDSTLGVPAYVRQNPWSAFDPEGLDMMKMAEALSEGQYFAALLEVGIGPNMSVADTIRNVNSAINTAHHVADTATGSYNLARKTGDGVVSATAQSAAMVVGTLVGTRDVTEGVIGAELNYSGGESGEADDISGDYGKRLTKIVMGSVQTVGTAVGLQQAGAGVLSHSARETGCFVAGTGVKTEVGSRRIEALQVGDRVTTSHNDSSTEVDPDTWRKVTLRMPTSEDPSDVCDVEMLRSEEWLGGCKPGGWIWFELEEMEVRGWAEVRSIDECPAIQLGSGRVVLATVTRYNTSVMEVRLERQPEPLRPTGQHRLFSATRNRWVTTDSLQPGEQLLTATGKSTVASVQPWLGKHRVFNIEVEADHCYFVGLDEILSHNACGPKRRQSNNTRLRHTDNILEQDVSISKTKVETDVARRKASRAREDLPEEIEIVDDKTKSKRRVQNRLDEYKGKNVDDVLEDLE